MDYVSLVFAFTWYVDCKFFKILF